MTSPDPSAGASLADEASMEGVLASIRRILEDDQPEPATATGQYAEKHRDDVPDPLREDVFVLDAAMMIEEPAPLAESDTGHLVPEPTALLAPEAQTAASSSLSELVRTLTDRRTAVYREGPTIEDLVREEMRPIVKSWLDANMAPMVERLVREEIERVVRHAMG